MTQGLIKGLISGSVIALVTMVSGIAGEATAGGMKTEKLNLAGTFLTSRIDANGDGEASSWCTLQVKSKKGNKGESMMQCINEDINLGPTPECPGGLYVIDAATGQGVGRGTRTFRNAKDQIYFVVTKRDLCADAVGQFTGVDSGVLVGGVGKFTGVEGTFEHVYTGQILYGDLLAVPAQIFGSLNATGTWEIIFPDSAK